MVLRKKHARGQSTEVDAYAFIKVNLREQGWDIRNPARNPQGQVYTQNECLSHPEIRQLLGLERPENIVKISETILWVIEAKREHGLLGKAMEEARERARKINQSRIIQVRMVSGVAGNPYDTYLVKTRYFNGKEYIPVTINEREISGFLSPSQAKTILESNNPYIADVQIDDRLFVSKAQEINEILYLGAVNPHQRASVMAALLLSMLDDTQPNIDASPSVLIGEINTRVGTLLKSQGKPEFYDYIRLNLPGTEDNHAKYKGAIVATLQELRNLNIRSAMNSGSDVLGKFYEVFLKYANWAQDLGIVLTPRHITQYAADVLNITYRDIVYDPCCGTGGFLVAAFDYVKKNHNKSQITTFKANSLFGVEQDPGVASLAIVNMIFRGDGKNNILEGNCFAKNLKPDTRRGIVTAVFSNSASGNPPVTRVLMNPPFALKRSDEKEYRFVDYALSQMADGGLLFSVLPYPCLVKPGKFKEWRRQLLRNHTLLSVVTFPEDLFYPIGVHTVGIFVKKGMPHPSEQNVLWIRALNDGLLKSKGKRLPSIRATNDLARVKDTLKAFLITPGGRVESIEQFQKACPVDFEDRHLELVPEAYLDQAPPTEEAIKRGAEHLIREAAAFIMTSRKDNGHN